MLLPIHIYYIIYFLKSAFPVLKQIYTEKRIIDSDNKNTEAVAK
jgi:hypothetical protein